MTAFRARMIENYLVRGMFGISPALGVNWGDGTGRPCGGPECLTESCRRGSGDPCGHVVLRPDIRARHPINLVEPTVVILAMVLHFFDAATAHDIVATFARAVTPGSYLVLARVSCRR
jgi:S-adenosyl methyltransferase